jgi:hypothetical protein
LIGISPDEKRLPFFGRGCIKVKYFYFLYRRRLKPSVDVM